MITKEVQRGTNRKWISVLRTKGFDAFHIKLQQTLRRAKHSPYYVKNKNLSGKSKRDSATLINYYWGEKIQKGKRRLPSSYILFGTMNNTALHLQQALEVLPS